MEQLGTLVREDKRFVFSYPALDLEVRGAFAEWVLEAAAEIIAEAEMHAKTGSIDELEALIEFEEASEVDLDIAKSELKSQFEAMPQCVVTIGDGDFRWVSREGRTADDRPVTRLIDMSLTRSDSFLKNDDGVGEGKGDSGLE